MINLIQLANFGVVGATATANLAAVNAGDLILAFFQVTNVNVNSITDPQGNVWTLSQNQHVVEVGSPFNLVSGWTIAKATGALAVAINMSAAGGGVAFGCAVQYRTTNIWAANPITQSAFRDCNGGNPNTVPAMPGAHVGSLCALFGSLYTTGTVWTAATAGYILRTGSGAGSVIGYCDSTTVGGVQTPQMTLAVNQNTFGLGFIIDEIQPTQNLTPQVGTIAMPGYSIQPIEEE